MSPYIDPHMQHILDRVRAEPGVDYRTLPVDEAKKTFEAQARPWLHYILDTPIVRDLTIPTAAGPMRARLFLPNASPNHPVILFAHGGGWTFGSVDSHDGIMNNLCYTSNCAVLGFDYRLAPEHPFPAALDDTLTALDFVVHGGLTPHVDPNRIALAGDSAGANLALGALLKHRDQGSSTLKTAALFYGCYAPVFETSSHQRCGEAFLLKTQMMRWYWDNFLAQGQVTSPYAIPLQANLSGLPHLYMNAASLDPVCDDTLLLCDQLTKAGVGYRFDLWPGVVHGFLRMTQELPMAQQALQAAGDFLKHHLTA